MEGREILYYKEVFHFFVHFHLAFPSYFSLICHSIYPSMVILFLFSILESATRIGQGPSLRIRVGVGVQTVLYSWVISLPFNISLYFFFFSFPGHLYDVCLFWGLKNLDFSFPSIFSNSFCSVGFFPG